MQKADFLGMRLAIFQATALTLWRDRAAFALTFLLPPVIFVIFAAVFSAAASGDITIRMGIVAPDDEISRELVSGLQDSSLVESLAEYNALAVLREKVSRDEIDAGLHIIKTEDTEPPKFHIYYDPVKSGAATLTEAALAALRPASEDEELSFEPAQKFTVSGDGYTEEVDVPMASYYAAGVGMLFIFLSGFQSALSVIEERDSGVVERIAAGPYGLRPMIDGKFAFLVVQGMGQLAVLLVVAKLFFGISFGATPHYLLVTIIVAAICAAGLCLAVVGCCRSRSQAHAIGAVLALIMGALGGSMAPRFLMSPEVRTLGGLTPNAWGIDAFGTILWRGGDVDALLVPWLLLLLSGIAGLLAAYFVMQHTLRAD